MRLPRTKLTPEAELSFMEMQGCAFGHSFSPNKFARKIYMYKSCVLQNDRILTFCIHRMKQPRHYVPRLPLILKEIIL